MAIQVKELIEAGVHFGHRASRWNPKMRPYIYGKRNLIHIIDLRETVRGLLRAYRYLAQTSPARAAWCCSSAPNARPRKPSNARRPAAACPTSASAGSAAR